MKAGKEYRKARKFTGDQGESILAQKWNTPQGGQVHYTDAAAGRGIK